MVLARDLSKAPGSAGVTGVLAPKLSRKAARATTSSAKGSSTAGPGWFDMQGAPRTPELEADLRLLAHRAALDPKHHYRRGVTSSLAPKKGAAFPVVQLGTIVEDPTSYYSDRLPKRMRARTVLDTLLRDVDRHQALKRRFANLQEKQRSVKPGRK